MLKRGASSGDEISEAANEGRKKSRVLENENEEEYPDTFFADGVWEVDAVLEAGWEALLERIKNEGEWDMGSESPESPETLS